MSTTRPVSRASSDPSLAGLPADPAARDLVAAEYVLGTLDAHLTARVAAALQSDGDWRAAVDAWQARLGPLATLARAESPPSNLWDRITERIAPAIPEKARQRRRTQHVSVLWAVFATMLAVAAVGYAFYPRSDAPRLIAVLVNDRNLPGVLIERDRSGGLLMSTMPATTGRLLQAPSGKVFQLWAVVPGTPRPVSLAVLPHEPGRSVVIKPSTAPIGPDVVIQISLEAEGGSTTGVPSGAVIYVGRLALVSADPGG